MLRIPPVLFPLSPPHTTVSHFVYLKICIVCTYISPTFKKLINSWHSLKITNTAKTLYVGENLPLSAKNDKIEADKLYSWWPNKLSQRAKCFYTWQNFKIDTTSKFHSCQIIQPGFKKKNLHSGNFYYEN